MHYRYAIAHPTPATEDQAIGTRMHTLLFDGEAAYMRGVVIGGPINPKTQKAYGRDTNAHREWCEAQGPGKEFLSIDEDQQVRSMVKAAMDDEYVARVIGDNAEGSDNEVSMVWIDPESGLLCKGRADMLRPGLGMIGDLKTCQDASPAAVERSILKWGYHRQAAWYTDGARVLGLDWVRHFGFLFVEKLPPYGLGLYRIQDDAVEIGRLQNARLRATVKQCRESGEWPGYSNGFADIGLSAWAIRQAMNELGVTEP